MTVSGAAGDLLERDLELSQLDGLMVEAQADGGRLVVVEGPAGIGKSRLLGATCALADDRGLVTLTARGSPLEREFPFGVARQLFEASLRGASDEERRALLAGAAELAEPVVSGAGLAARETIFPSLHGLFWLCVNLADRVPLLLAVDDVHWADEASVRWLSYLARRLEDVRALLVIARRPAEPEVSAQLLDSLAAEPWARVLRLAPLSENATLELTRQSVGDEGAGEFARVCYERTAGNPFLVQHLLAALTAEGVDPSSEEGLARVRTLRPERVSRTVLARVGGLSVGCQSLVAAAAVLGSEVELRQAAELARLDLGGAAEARGALTAVEILRDRGPLEFAHPIARDAIYEDLGAARRAEMHRRAARLLYQDGDSVERVAAHLLAGQPTGDGWAVGVLREAAQVATAQGVHEQAVRYLERALAEPPTREHRSVLLRELGEAQARVAPSAAIGPLSEALRLCEDWTERLEISRQLANAMMNNLGPVDAFDALEQAIDGLPTSADRESRLRAEAELLAIGMMSPVLSDRVATRMAALPELAGGTPGERLVLANLARHRSITGAPWREVVALADLSLADGQLLSDQIPDSVTFPMAVLLILIDGRASEADRLISLLSPDSGRRGSLVGAALSSVSVARVADVIGDVRVAESAARETLERALEAGRLTSIPLAVHILVRTLVQRGQLGEADEILERFDMSGELPDALMFFNHVLLARGQLRIAQHRARDGVADLFEISRRDRESGSHEVLHLWRSLAAPGLVALGQREQAVTLVEQELEQERARRTPLTIAMALRALGNLVGGPVGIQHLRESVELLASCPFRLEHAHSLADLGAALRRSNERTEAREVLRMALDLGVRCGADALIIRARSELQASGAKPRKLTLTGVESLTPGERRVAELAARGFSNPQIAQQLFVTRKTIELHLGNAYRKLNINSRHDLAAALQPDRGARDSR